jgi:protein-L-isoaspartate O-methyltransferase
MPRYNMTEDSLIDYYSRRAADYERIYHKPERQTDLARLRERLRSLLTGRRVLELACGTGYWTAVIADVVVSVLATDASEAVLEIARSKALDVSRVNFARADAWHASEIRGNFDAGLAAFWWSHVPKQQLASFLFVFHAALRPAARLVFVDNRFVAGSSTAISRRDDANNTYQVRQLEDVAAHEVLKNFPNRAELLALVEPHAREVELVESEYFWCLSYKLNVANP